MGLAEGGEDAVAYFPGGLRGAGAEGAYGGDNAEGVGAGDEGSGTPGVGFVVVVLAVGYCGGSLAMSLWSCGDLSGRVMIAREQPTLRITVIKRNSLYLDQHFILARSRHGRSATSEVVETIFVCVPLLDFLCVSEHGEVVFALKTGAR